MKDDQKRIGRLHFRHQQLDRWLREWKCMRELEPARSGPPVRNARVPAPSFTPEPEPGQIRLVAPSLPETFVMPLTIALLPAAHPGYRLAVPFSPLSTPASPGELQLERPPPLSVVCLDMATVLPASCVRHSRWVDDLSDDEWLELEAVYQSAMTGTRTRALPTARTGPPLWHPRDPRHAYFEWQATRMDALTRSASMPTLCYDRLSGSNGMKRSRAAETRAPYTVATTLTIEGTPWVLCVHPADPEGLRLVETRSSHPPAITHELDGGRLVIADRSFAGTVHQGRAVLAADALNLPLRLEMPDGGVYRLRRPG